MYLSIKIKGFMSNLINDKKNILWSAAITVILTIILSSFMTSWSKLNNVVTKDVMIQQIQKSNEILLEESRKYTDDRFKSVLIYYNTNFEQLEKLMRANDAKSEVLLKSINERLDRINKRIDNNINRK